MGFVREWNQKGKPLQYHSLIAEGRRFLTEGPWRKWSRGRFLSLLVCPILFGEILALIFNLSGNSVKWSVSWGDVVNSPIVSVEWPVVGRPAWCHILGEKKYRLFHRTPRNSTIEIGNAPSIPSMFNHLKWNSSKMFDFICFAAGGAFTLCSYLYFFWTLPLAATAFLLNLRYTDLLFQFHHY